VPRILELTGAASWEDLLGEWAGAVLLNGMGTPRGPRSFSTYDFVSLNDSFDYNQKPPGTYPWPVNTFGTGSTAQFSTVTHTGNLGPGGLRVYDLTSDGLGLGLEVHASGTRSPVRLTVARIQ
jgi:hypothetical protein